MELTYKGFFTFSTLDISDFGADPPIEFEAPLHRSKEWLEAYKDIYGKDDYTLDEAKRMVLVGIDMVIQSGNRFPVVSLEDVDALQEAIEISSPGYGESFIKHLALSVVVALNRESFERKKKFKDSQTQSDNGKANKKSSKAKV